MEPVSLLFLKPVIEQVIANYIAPKLEILSKKLGTEYNKLLIPRNEHFSEYLYTIVSYKIIIYKYFYAAL